MKSIETKYRGRFFRSRLESRWAVFFDLIKLPWEYEIVGYHLESTSYLPDFVFPSIPAHAEIKPTNISEDDEARLKRISLEMPAGIGDVFMIIRGSPCYDDYSVSTTRKIDGEIVAYTGMVFARCRRCDGLCLVNAETWMDIGRHTCGDHEAWPVMMGAFADELEAAMKYKFDHLAANGGGQ